MDTIKRITRSEYFPLALLILAGLLTAAFTLPQYGEGWDDYNYYIHARQSLRAYAGLFLEPGQPVLYDPTYRFYGPSFMMLVVLVAKLFPNAILSDVGHALSLITFQAGVILLYALARRWFKPWAAFGTAALFATQPLLLGHAFINPKDTPFMVGFLASILFGLNMVDAYREDSDAPASSADLNSLLRRDWFRALRTTRIWVAVSLIPNLILSLALTLGIFRLRETYYPPNFYDPHTAEFERYLYGVLTQAGHIILFFVFFLLFFMLFTLPRFPGTQRAILDGELKPAWGKIRRYARMCPLVIAGLALGFTTSIRFLALAAGAFVGIYLLWKHGRRAIHYLLTYIGLALVASFVTWPYLWPAPLFRFLVTLKVMANFPWPGQALFEGVYLETDALPWYYLPKLIGIQLTEPLVLLALAGLVLLLVQVLRQRVRGDLLYFTGVWFLAPVAAAVVVRPDLYDNFRQLHFILPPLFLLAGLVLDKMGDWLKNPLARVILLLLLLAPGLLGMAQLHPYEYIYYNSFVGGTPGAFRGYETDYWGTSFRNALGYINANAPEESRVVVWGPLTSAWAYARPDLEVVSNEEPGVEQGPFFALISSRYDNDLKLYPHVPDLYRVEQTGLTLAVVKWVEIPYP